MNNDSENQFLKEEGCDENENSYQIFNSSLQEYLRLTEEIKKLQKAIKIRRERKENISNIILTFLNEKNIKQINLEGDYSGKQISEKVSTTTTGFSKSAVDTVLLEHFGNNVTDYNKINDMIATKLTKKENIKLSLNNIKKEKVDLKKIKDEQAKHIESLLNE